MEFIRGMLPWHHSDALHRPSRENVSMAFVIPAPRVAAVPVKDAAEDLQFPIHRIYCVGRNYVEHAIEMGFTGREPPFFFMKPADAVLPIAEGEVGRMPYPTLTNCLLYTSDSA